MAHKAQLRNSFSSTVFENSNSSSRHCPVCQRGGRDANGCKPAPTNQQNGAWWCRSYPASKGQKINGWLGLSNSQEWGVFVVPDPEYKASANRQVVRRDESKERKSGIEERRIRRESRSKSDPTPQEKVSLRDAGYRALMSLNVPLHPKQRENLLSRGLAEAQLDQMIASGAIIPVAGSPSPGFGFNVPGWSGAGYLITARSDYGTMIGAQFAPLSPEPGRKYTWGKSKGHTSHLANGEMPINVVKVERPGSVATTPILIEGFLKPIVLAKLIESGAIPVSEEFGSLIIIGAAGGQFVQSIQQIEAVLQSANQPPILIPDSDSFGNQGVLSRCIDLAESVEDLRYADWGQCYGKSQPDGDEAFGIEILKNLRPFNVARILGEKMLVNGIFKQAEHVNEVRTANMDTTKALLKDKVRVVVRDRLRLDGGLVCSRATHAITAFGDFSSAIKKFAFSYKFLKDEAFLKLCDQCPQIVIEDERDRLIPWVLMQKEAEMKTLQKTEFKAKYNSDNAELVEAMKRPGAIVLKAPLGSGKTYLFSELLDEFNRALMCVPRTELGKQLAASTKASTHKNASQSKVTNRLVTTVSSLKEENGYLSAMTFEKGSIHDTFTDNRAVVVLDEFETILASVVAGDIDRRDRKDKLDLLGKIIRDAKHLWAIDGNMTPWTYKLISTLRGGNTQLFVNSTENMEGRNLYQINSAANLLNLIAKFAKQGKRLAIAVDNAEANTQNLSVEGLAKYLEKNCGISKEKICRVTSYTQRAVDHKNYATNPDNLGDFQIVLYTSVWESGISIGANQKFDAVFGCFTGINSPDTCYQMLNRVRHNCDRYVYAQSGAAHGVTPNDAIDLVRKNLEEVAEELLVKKAQDEEIDFAEDVEVNLIAAAYSQEVSIDTESPFGQWKNRHEIYEVATAAAYRESILGLAQLAGYTLMPQTTLEDQPKLAETQAQKKAYREQCKALRDKRRQHVIDATSISREKFKKIATGEDATMEELSAAVKAPVEFLTDGNVTMETIHEVEVYEKTRGMEGMDACIKAVRKDAAGIQQEQVNALIQANHKANFLADNARFSKATRLKWCFDNFGEVMMKMHHAATNEGWWGCSKDEDGLYHEALKILGSVFAEYKRLFYSYSEGKDLPQTLSKIAQWMGFECKRNRKNATGTRFQFVIPALTQRVVNYQDSQTTEISPP